jgi:hypothetical protein
MPRKSKSNGQQPALAPGSSPGQAVEQNPLTPEGLTLSVHILPELVERLRESARDENRLVNQQAEWLLWDAIRNVVLEREVEQPIPYKLVTTNLLLQEENPHA